MHPFPPATELEFLIGLRIGQICLDPWSTQFRFEDGGQITVMGAFEHIDVQGRSRHHQHEEEQDFGQVFFRDLLQQDVVTLQREEWLLTLVFENGAILRIASEPSRFENGGIYPPGASPSETTGLVVF